MKMEINRPLWWTYDGATAVVGVVGEVGAVVVAKSKQVLAWG